MIRIMLPGTVYPEPVNAAPVAAAGDDDEITLPVSTVSLSGSGTDSDGSVASYAWEMVSGPGTAVISSASDSVTGVTALVEGTYVFRLTVTDDRGAADVDDVQVVVNPEPSGIFNDLNGSVSGFAVTVPDNSLPFNISAPRDGQADVHVYDASGTKIMTFNGVALTAGTNAVGRGSVLQPGLYLIYVNDGSTSWSGKAIIMK